MAENWIWYLLLFIISLGALIGLTCKYPDNVNDHFEGDPRNDPWGV